MTADQGENYAGLWAAHLKNEDAPRFHFVDYLRPQPENVARLYPTGQGCQTLKKGGRRRMAGLGQAGRGRPVLFFTVDGEAKIY